MASSPVAILRAGNESGQNVPAETTDCPATKLLSLFLFVTSPTQVATVLSLRDMCLCTSFSINHQPVQTPVSGPYTHRKYTYSTMFLVI